MPDAHEINFDGLIGPTHNYAGLSYGNVASLRHRHEPSNPREAALQGLAKMKQLADLGLMQAVLPPQPRPDLRLLRRVGFDGPEADMLQRAHREAPELLAACYSASSMWAANAATVSPAADCEDDRVHFTPANLLSELHRSIEPVGTAAVLRRIFDDASVFAHHDPLPGALALRDEGAANHTRLGHSHDEPGVELFVYGVRALDPSSPKPIRYPARQTREASEAVARLHGLDPDATLFAQQHPDAIDAGVFHNDVAAVGHLDVLFCHADAFVDQRRMLDRLRAMVEEICATELRVIEVRPEQVTLAEAVETYLFNSQLVRLPDGTTTLIAPTECQEHERVSAYLDALIESDAPIDAVHFVDVRQSMRNGGGPACLRLRVALAGAERERMHTDVMLTGELYAELVSWVERHYRDELTSADLADPQLVEEARAALDELTVLLGLGAVYAFQHE